MSFNNNLGLPDNYMTSNNSIISYGEIDFYCIFDRTQADVDRVEYLTRVILAHENTEEEFEEYQQDLKGALNYSDLERIENNITLLASWIGLPLEDMSRNVIPRIPYFINLLENVKIIRESPYHYTSSPQVPDMPLNTYQKINDIERILYNAYWMWLKTTGAFYYCGDELYADGLGLI